MEDNELVLYLLQKTYFFKKFKESMKNALESEDFDDAVNHLNSASEDIATLEEFIKEMKQEDNDKILILFPLPLIVNVISDNLLSTLSCLDNNSKIYINNLKNKLLNLKYFIPEWAIYFII